ncbi:hypothetical protein IHE44_0007800 [Lamprotornis superbus]|uniref:Uncharacterized protein n=1 Tax=Lamprotornis superbus TaxID=245042 RepID=A0A835NRK5_9PASS|nr:hypothetical protein IHE44_0007800 [Lamprotornis superbus]
MLSIALPARALLASLPCGFLAALFLPSNFSLLRGLGLLRRVGRFAEADFGLLALSLQCR